jgi:hypothetical protein
MTAIAKISWNFFSHALFLIIECSELAAKFKLKTYKQKINICK